MKANFSLVHNDLNTVLIKDNANETQTMSVTNDAENVVKFLKDKAILIGNARLFSICTDGSVDELIHDGNGEFLMFRFAAEDEEQFYTIFFK